MTSTKCLSKMYARVLRFTRNQISGMQHDWGKFRHRNTWKWDLFRNIVSGVCAPMLIISGMLGFVFFCLFFRAHFYPVFIAMIFVTVLVGAYFVWSYICIDAMEEEKKSLNITVE